MANRIKIKVIKDYKDVEENFYFLCGDVYIAENNEFSDFYHIWDKNKLYIILKECCEII